MGAPRLGLAARFAARELRGGIRGFRVFLVCLALGVAAVAAVGSVRTAIDAGLAREGRTIVGGDAQITATYRAATEAERAWMENVATRVSEVVDFRSMARAESGETGETGRGLTQVKAVDDAYPLAGEIVLSPDIPLAEALETRGGTPGLVMEPVLIDRLGIAVGESVRLGGGEFELRAALEREPDRAGGGFGLGPRIIVARPALEGTGLLAPGTLYETHYRLALPEGAELAALKADLEATFPDAGLRWRDRTAAAPGVERFVERIGGFLVLVGLAALAVGGTGVAAAVRAYMEEKTETIATLKTIGATGAEVFAVYLLQVGALAALGIAIGLAIGAGGPLLAGPLLADRLPVPALFGVYAAPLAEAALYGALTALVFALWPLARAREVRPARLFRDLTAPGRRWPAPPYLAAVLVAAGALGAAAVAFSDAPRFAAAFVAGVVVALALLGLLARGIRRLAGRAARSRMARGRPALRLALAAVGGPGGDTVAVVLALGLGLTVLAAIGQVDRNLQSAIAEELPAESPAFFFVDIQNAQLDPFLETVDEVGAAERVETAPMLRGIITKLDGVPAQKAEIDPEGAWMLRGDRGVTYAATPPPGTELVAGEWWPEDHAGETEVSFSAEHAAELGLGLGDTLTVSVLGREMTARVTSLREVDFSDLGINFLMVFDPASFAGAPHTHIATVYAPPEAEGRLMREVSDAFPNVTAIRVRDALDRVSDGLGQIAAAARWAAAVTLVTGLVVLVGAAAAGERRRTYEAAILKVMGATRRRILATLAMRAAFTGAAAGLLAVVLGGVAGWAVVTFVLGTAFTPALWASLALVAGGAVLSLVAGLAFAARALGVPAARTLRARE
jgi:putative ABC transport system permease protein